MLSLKALPSLLESVKIYQQIRCMTNIVKRRHTAPLAKPENSPSLRRKHRVYDLVQDSSYFPKDIDIILKKYVEDVGRPGDLVQVKEKEGRILIMSKSAVYASPENLKKMQVASTDEKSYSTKYAGTTINMFRNAVFGICMNHDNPWTIEKHHIRASFRKARFHVPDDAITMPKYPISGPDMNLEGKTFLIRITINGVDSSPVRCRVHHWTTNPDKRLPPVRMNWKLPTPYIFPEDEEIAKNELPEIIPYVFTEKDDLHFASPKIRKYDNAKYIKRIE